MRVTELLRHSPELVRTFGAKGLRHRAKYELLRRSGGLRKRTPISGWQDVEPYQGKLGNIVPAAVNPATYRRLLTELSVDPEAIVQKADEVLAGNLSFFSGEAKPVGFPPAWHLNPVSGKAFPSNDHWTHIPDLSPKLGDIKLVWEPSRFSFAFTLVRAYAATADERYAEDYWHAFEDWCSQNPPNAGPNWRCGQESALRLIAWLFAWGALRDADATSDERLGALLKAVSVTADRIEANIGYALSQRNNHGISEAAGLWTAGLLLPDHRRAKHWRELGQRLLDRLAIEQFGFDGGYIQQSTNYQRLALQLYLWCQRLGEINGESLSDATLARVDAGVKLLYQLQDAPSGRLPNYGANDGALLFPLTEADYEDYRPTLQVLSFRDTGKLRYAIGPHDELAWWFYGEEVLDSPREELSRSSLQADESGYYTLRGKDSFAFIRATTFKTRPSQADNLHVDIWHQGNNIAFDPGTYSYNSPPPWNNGLVHTRVHNTVTMDDADQMTRGGRFLWFNWVSSEVLRRQSGKNWEYLEFSHTAFQHLDSSARHRRALLRMGDTYICLDEVAADEPHRWKLNWNLFRAPDKWSESEQLAEYSLSSGNCKVQVISDSDRISLVEARQGDTRGWRSTRYLQREAAVSLQSEQHQRKAWWITLFGHERATIQDGKLVIDTDQQRVMLPFTPHEPERTQPLLQVPEGSIV